MPKIKESEKSLLKAIKRDLRWLRRNERKRIRGKGKFSGDKRNKKVKFHEYIDDMKRIGLPLEELYKAVASLFAHNIGLNAGY